MKITDAPHISWIQDKVRDLADKGDHVSVSTDHGIYTCSEVFSSIFKGNIDKDKHLYVAQHFRGWFIKTAESVFKKDTATFMDFRIDQAGDCRFFYVLPTSETEALVEIAIFSNDVMEPEDYDPLIKDYIKVYLNDLKYEIGELSNLIHNNF